MEIHKIEEKREVEFWLTKAEKEDKVQEEELKSCYKALSVEKYKVFVLISGNQPLYESTFQLLQQNLRHSHQTTDVHI